MPGGCGSSRGLLSYYYFSGSHPVGMIQIIRAPLSDSVICAINSMEQLNKIIEASGDRLLTSKLVN
jgi:hypothetical protein